MLFKHAANFGIAMVTKGGLMRLKNDVFLKITSFKLSESFKAAAHDQSLLEIFIPSTPKLGYR